MKKPLYVTFSILLLCSIVAICCLTCLDGSNLAYAADDTTYELETETRTVELLTLTYNGNPVGVRMRDYFFGMSDIPVTVNVYSSDSFVIDFAIGADESTLTDEQQTARQTLIEVFTEMVEYVDYVDAIANTQSGGLFGQEPSDVYRYNNVGELDDPKAEVVDGGYKIEIAEDTYAMLEIAQEMYLATGGGFNPAVYRLVDLWGFSSRTYYVNGKLPYDRVWKDGYPLPEQKYIDAFSSPNFTDFSESAVKLSQEDGKYYVTKMVAPATVGNESYQQWIDLGGIAKGYVVDVLKAKLYDVGIDSFNVNAGSSSIAFGNNFGGGDNLINIENAFNKYAMFNHETALEVSIGKCSTSTSGQYIRNYSVDGVEYAHIVDAQTGAPAQKGVRSVLIAVPAGDNPSDFWAARGDCLTTALTVMGYDGIVDFIGDYLQANGIKIVVQYETLVGGRQLISTFDMNSMSNVGEGYGELHLDERGFYVADYVEPNDTADYTWVLITLGCVFGAGMVALVVYHFVRGKNRAATNVQNAKKSKPFRLLDIMVYVGVLLVILVLFYVFLFDVESSAVQLVYVVDDQTGDTLFVYNLLRNEYVIYDNTDWTVDVNKTNDGLRVTFTRQFKDEERFNTLEIVRGLEPSVKMIDSICGNSQDCVRNFPALTASNGAIVCSPNRLKIVTE